MLGDLVEVDRPLVAYSNWPGFCGCAPVNAPFSWPKSSDSRSPAGIAAQLTLMKGNCSARPQRPTRCSSTCGCDDERHRGAPEDPGERYRSSSSPACDAKRDREARELGVTEVIEKSYVLKLQRVTGAGDEPSASVELGWQVQPAFPPSR